MGHAGSPGTPQASELAPVVTPSSANSSMRASVSDCEKPRHTSRPQSILEDRPTKDEEAGEPSSPRSAEASSGENPLFSPDGKRVMTQDDCYDVLGYSWPSWKKWMLLSSIFAVQVSMNFNTSVYPSVVTPLSEKFGVSEQAARVGQFAFLVLYAFGCELWAPWSEEFGRWPILQYVSRGLPPDHTTVRARGLNIAAAPFSHDVTPRRRRPCCWPTCHAGFDSSPTLQLRQHASDGIC